MATATIAHPFKVGDIFVNSWGYDQTNIDFYEVVAVTAKSIRLARIAKGSVDGTEGFMTDKVVALPGQFVERDGKRIEMTKFPYQWSYGGREPEWGVNFPYGSGNLWNGEATRRSWYA